MKKILLILIVTGLVSACETAPVRRIDYVSQHPEWEPKMVKLIKMGMIAKGMSQEQVRASWGRHCYTCQGTSKGSWGESWEYITQVVFFDTQGKVVRHEAK